MDKLVDLARFLVDLAYLVDNEKTIRYYLAGKGKIHARTALFMGWKGGIIEFVSFAEKMLDVLYSMGADHIGEEIFENMCFAKCDNVEHRGYGLEVFYALQKGLLSFAPNGAIEKLEIEKFNLVDKYSRLSDYSGTYKIIMNNESTIGEISLELFVTVDRGQVRKLIVFAGETTEKRVALSDEHGDLVLIPFREIMFIETGRTHLVWARYKGEQYYSRDRMRDIAPNLPKCFKRVRKSHAVNINFVKMVNKSRRKIVMENNSIIVVSKKYYPGFRLEFEKDQPKNFG